MSEPKLRSRAERIHEAGGALDLGEVPERQDFWSWEAVSESGQECTTLAYIRAAELPRAEEILAERLQGDPDLAARYRGSSWNLCRWHYTTILTIEKENHHP